MREKLNFYQEFKFVDRDSLADIAAHYGVDGPGIKSRWGTRFFAPVQTGPGPNQVFFPEIKRLGRGADHPPPSSAEIKERVELSFYSSSGPSWLVLGELYLYLLQDLNLFVKVIFFIKRTLQGAYLTKTSAVWKVRRLL